MTNYQLTLLSSLLFCGSALANSLDYTPPTSLSDAEFDVGFSLDVLKGKAKEYIYQGVSTDIDNLHIQQGHKNSQLNWKIDHAPIAKLHVNWTPLKYFSLGVDGWTTFGIKGSGEMDDYDWLDRNDPSRRSHWSTHPDTDLTFANQLNMQLTGWIFNEPQVALGGIIGYQLTDFKWEAYGGYGDYDGEAKHWPSGQKGITYRQKYRLPYIGLSGRFRLSNFEVDMLYKYSNWVRAQSVDNHHLRYLTYISRGYDATYNGAKLTFGYYIQPTIKIYIDSEWNQYSQGKGWLQAQKHISNENIINHGVWSGLKNNNYQFGLGIMGLF